MVVRIEIMEPLRMANPVGLEVKMLVSCLAQSVVLTRKLRS